MTTRFLVIAVWLLTTNVHAQIQIGTIKGTVNDPAGSVLAAASVRLTNAITGERVETVTDDAGSFVFNNVPFNRYLLRVEGQGFAPQAQLVAVNSNLPVVLSISLSVAGVNERVSIAVQENLVDPTSAVSATTLSENFIQRAPRINRGRQLQELVAMVPGTATENNGLLHVRGVEDGILYVLDGVPIADRLDSLSASSLDTDTINVLQVITGNFPAEFSGRNGAVVIVQPKSGIDQAMTGNLRAGIGDFHTGDIAAAFGRSFGKSLGKNGGGEEHWG
jgi:hypothetical protein